MTENWIAYLSFEVPKGQHAPAVKKKLQGELEKLLTVKQAVVTNVLKQGATPKTK